RRAAAPLRLREHGPREIARDDAVAARREEVVEDAGAARRVEHEAAGRDLRERAAERTLEEPVVHAAREAAVPPPLVAGRVDALVARQRAREASRIVRRLLRQHARTIARMTRAWNVAGLTLWC